MYLALFLQSVSHINGMISLRILFLTIHTFLNQHSATTVIVNVSMLPFYDLKSSTNIQRWKL